MASKPADWALRFVRLRWFFLTIVALMTVFAGYNARKLEFNFSPDNIYLANDPAHKFHVEQFLKEFGHTANVCIVAIDGDLATEEVQGALKELHKKVSTIPQVETVHSLVNTSIFWEVDGVLTEQDVFDKNGRTNEKILDWAAGDPAMQGLLISKEGRIPTVAVRLPLDLGDMTTGDEASLALKDAISKVSKNYKELDFYLAGSPVLQLETISTLKSDQLLLLPITVLLMALLLWLSFHSLRGVILPFIATFTATVWAMGWLVFMDHPLDVINNKLAVLLLVIGISSAVQFFARFQDEFEKATSRAEKTGENVDRDDVVARCVQALVFPCLMTTAIAALGFAAVAVSSVTIIRNFALDASVGIMGSYVTTMLFVPAMLRILPAPNQQKIWHANRKRKFSIDKILIWFSRFSMRRPKQIVFGALLLAGVGIYLAKDIRANQRLASEIPQGAPTLLALQFIEEHITGVMPFEVVFEGEPQRLRQPDVVRAGAYLEDFMRKQDLEPTTRSFGDILQSIARSYEGKMPDSVANWSDDKIEQFTELFEAGDPKRINEARQDFYSEDMNFYRVQGLLKDASTTELGKFRDIVTHEVESLKLEDVKIHVTGAAMISANALDHIIYSTIASVGVAIVAIFLLVFLLLKSFRFALIALFPNLLPIIVTLAFMNTIGVSLRVATVLIFSMAFAIAVDACVYLITRFRQEAMVHGLDDTHTHTMKLYAIIERTMRGSGRPVVYTTLLLLAGFSALSISDFEALRDFAILSSVTLGTALVVDLLLWPALVLLVKPEVDFGQ